MYEAFICCNNQVEKLLVGILEKILPHVPGLNNLYTKGIDANYKLESPKLPAPSWFSRATFTRLLHIIGSTDFFDIAVPIQCELSQLEESRTCHLSSYGHGHDQLWTFASYELFNIKYTEGLLLFPGAVTQVAAITCAQLTFEVNDSPKASNTIRNCKLLVLTNDSSSPQIEVPCEDVIHICLKNQKDSSVGYPHQNEEAGSGNLKTSSLDDGKPVAPCVKKRFVEDSRTQ